MISRLHTVLFLSILATACQKGGKDNKSARSGDPEGLAGQTDDPAGGEEGNESDDGGSDTNDDPGHVPAAGTIAVTGSVAAGSGANEVVAVSIDGGRTDFTRSDRVARAPVSDGQLAVDLSQSSDGWVMMMNDSDTLALLGEPSPTDRLGAIKGFIGLPAQQDTLLQLPLRDASGDIDVGEIANPGADQVAAGSVTTEAAATTLNVGEEKLQEMATIDDTLRHIKNNFANFDSGSNTYYQANPFFNWRAEDKNAVGTYLLPTDLAPRGFGIYFRTNDVRADFAKICTPDGSAGFTNLAIYPPAGSTVTQNSINYTASNPFSNAGVQAGDITTSSCGKGTLYVKKDEGVGDLSFNVGGDGFESPLTIPAGIWNVKLGTTEVAAFDLAMASPVDADGHSRVWVPVFKVEKDANDYIIAVKAKLVRWDRQSAQFVEVDDVSTFLKSTSSLTMSITDHSGTDGTLSGARVVNSFETIKRQDPTGNGNEFVWTGITPPFKIPGTANVNKGSAPHDPVAESITVDYQMNNISFRFDLRVVSP